MELKLDIELLPYLEDLANICIGNKSPEDVGAGEYTTLPEIFALVQYNQSSKEYTAHAIRKIRAFEDKVVHLRKKLEMLKRNQEVNDRLVEEI